MAEWGGDRAALYEGPDGAWAVVLSTAWRTEAGASAFMAGTTQRLVTLGGHFQSCGDATHVNVVIASAESLVQQFLDCNA